MNESPSLGLVGLLCLLLVVGIAAGVRLAYVANYSEDGHAVPVFAVQGQGPARQPTDDSEPVRTELEELAHNLRTKRAFASRAPLAEREEDTAHVAPGYPWLYSLAERAQDHPEMLVRWVQCGLGALTVLCYFLFARRAFGSTAVATLAGLLGAVYPFWIINTAELADGVLVSFLLAAVLVLGTRGSQTGGAFTSVAYGLALAALAMVRAALLPFVIVAFVWYLARCRHARSGWFAGLLALLGFVNGLAPWALRNWQVLHEPMPIVDSAYLHLWMGNNPRATGAELDETILNESLPPELRAQLAEMDQPRRYARLGPEVLAQVAEDPSDALGRRLDAGASFLVGKSWLSEHRLVTVAVAEDLPELPAGFADTVEATLRASLLLLLLVGALGWRWSAAWGWPAQLAAIAVVWVPLPYVLSHAETMSGPRLPLDGVLLCYVAFAVACLIPGMARRPEQVTAAGTAETGTGS
jgi:4-amino-4-deoxy-L-arabinose transferase-like glycosyltransferase